MRWARLCKLFLNLLSFLFAVSGDGESLVSLHFWNWWLHSALSFLLNISIVSDYLGYFIKYCVFLSLFLLLPKLSFILRKWKILLTCPSNPLTFCCCMSWWSNASIMITVGKRSLFSLATQHYCMAGIWFFKKINLKHSEQFCNIRCQNQQSLCEPF